MSLYLFFISLFIFQSSSYAHGLILPSTGEDKLIALWPNKTLELEEGKYQLNLQIGLECAVIPDRDKAVHYYVLLGERDSLERFDVNPCFSEPRVYAFENKLVKGKMRRISEQQFNLSFSIAKQPLYAQYFMEVNQKVFASSIVQLIRPIPSSGAAPLYYWQSQPNSLSWCIDDGYDHLVSEEHFGAQGFPCNGLEQYIVNKGLNSDEIIATELEGKEKSTFRLLDLGTANGSLLTHLKKRFHFNWGQLVGVSARDHRTQGNAEFVPDSSYFLHNIEKLQLIEHKLGLFDVIFSKTTWFYLKDPLSSLAMAYDLLKENGVLYIQISSERFLEHGLELESLVAHLKRAGYPAELIHDTPTNESNRNWRNEYWFKLRKNKELPHLVFPYFIQTTESSDGLIASYKTED